MRRRPSLRKLGKAALALAVIAPTLLFAASNLFLNLPAGRKMIASRIERVIGLETTAEGATWSPWNGFTLRGLHVRQPVPLRSAIRTPLLTAESIRIHPDWRALLRKRFVIRGVELNRPDLAAPIELLALIPSAPAPPPVASIAKEPEVALQPPADIPEGDAPPAPGVIAPPTVATETAATPEAVTTPTVWIRFRQARMRIVGAGANEPLCQISQIDGAVPFGGKAAKSVLRLRGMGFARAKVPELRIPLGWDSPVLHIGMIDAGALGIDCKLEAKIGLTPGVPFLIGGAIPKQDGREIAFSETLRAKLGSIAGQGRLQGYALAPGSWQGQCVVRALAVDAEFAGNKALFHHGQGLVVFQQGALRCLDARLVGDDAGFLGNGMALSDGRFAANLRIVAAPENLAAISRRIQSDPSPPQLTPLSTPQRAALDMRVFGFPGQVFFQANPAAKPLLVR